MRSLDKPPTLDLASIICWIDSPASILVRSTRQGVGWLPFDRPPDPSLLSIWLDGRYNASRDLFGRPVDCQMEHLLRPNVGEMIKIGSSHT